MNYRKRYIELVWETSLFWVHVLLSMPFFVVFFVYSLPLPKWRTCWMTAIAMVGILFDISPLCFSFSFSGYDFTLIKKNYTLNCYLFLQKFLLKNQKVANSLLIAVVAQFTAKTTNLQKAMNFFVTYFSFNK